MLNPDAAGTAPYTSDGDCRSEGTKGIGSEDVDKPKTLNPGGSGLGLIKVDVDVSQNRVSPRPHHFLWEGVIQV